MQNICTEGKGVITPMKKEIILVREVMVILTAASAYVLDNRSATVSWRRVLLHAANITKVSSMPIPKIEKSLSFKYFERETKNKFTIWCLS